MMNGKLYMQYDKTRVWENKKGIEFVDIYWLR